MCKKHSRFMSALLLAALLLSAVGCGNDSGPTGNSGSEDSSADNSETSTETAKSYEYADMGGREFRVLNAADIYSMHANIDRETTNGDMLNDAEYNRCRLLEEKMNIVFNETNQGVDNEVADTANRVLMAGEDAYDVIFMPARNLYSFLENGSLFNLLDFDELQLDEPWWLSNYNDPSILNGSLYAAASYSQLMIIDSVWSVYYNESIGENLGLDTPYSIVKDGNWTLDTMKTYLKAAANLNGDDSFSWNDSGSAIYGIALDHSQHILTCAGERIIESENGQLVFTAGTDRFYDVVSKITQVFTEDDGCAQYKHIPCGDDDPGHYIYTFEHERSLMMVAEVCKTNRMRDKNYSFGILPMPKYDEEQENYIGKPFYGTPCLTIPVTVKDPENVAAIADALAYLSYETVWPVFRKVTLEQKNLRNEESIEMLDIIINSIVPDLTTIYGVGSDFEIKIKDLVTAGDDSVSSVVASYKDKIQTELDKING